MFYTAVPCTLDLYDYPNDQHKCTLDLATQLHSMNEVAQEERDCIFRSTSRN